MIINNYKFTRNEDGYLTGFVKNDTDYEFTGQMANYPNACDGYTKFENGNFVVDETKKAEIISNNEKQQEITDLKSKLNESDYLVSRTFEQVMALSNPLTFVSDLLKITKEYREKYAETITNRETWRKRIEELEK